MDKLALLLGDGLIVSVTSKGTVFMVLFVLVVSIALTYKLIKSNKKPVGGLDTNIIEQVTEGTTATNLEDSDELIVVIAAAVAAALNRSSNSIIVRSVTRIPNTSPVWNQAGRHDQIASKL